MQIKHIPIANLVFMTKLFRKTFISVDILYKCVTIVNKTLKLIYEIALRDKLLNK